MAHEFVPNRGHPCSVAHWWHMQPVPLVPWCLDSIFVLSQGNIVTVASCIRPPSLQLHVMGENFLQAHFLALFGLFLSLQYSGGTVLLLSCAMENYNTVSKTMLCADGLKFLQYRHVYTDIYIFFFSATALMQWYPIPFCDYTCCTSDYVAHGCQMLVRNSYFM